MVVWLSKLYMVYRKKFYPLEKFETSPEDGAKTRELNWHLKSDIKSDLFLDVTTVLVQQFKEANLHMPATGFAERAIRLPERTRFVRKIDGDSAS